MHRRPMLEWEHALGFGSLASSGRLFASCNESGNQMPAVELLCVHIYSHKFVILIWDWFTGGALAAFAVVIKNVGIFLVARRRILFASNGKHLNQCVGIGLSLGYHSMQFTGELTLELALGTARAKPSWAHLEILFVLLACVRYLSQALLEQLILSSNMVKKCLFLSRVLFSIFPFRSDAQFLTVPFHWARSLWMVRASAQRVVCFLSGQMQFQIDYHYWFKRYK